MLTPATNTNSYCPVIQKNMLYALNETNFSFGKKIAGKVRDIYDLGDKLLLITTDRLSAFDRVLTTVPYKGQVLNLVSAWWFEQTKHIVKNHVIAVPDPNVIIAKKCTVFPIEFVVRGYITGTTNTSLWTQYQKGVRLYCGHHLPENLLKNQKLEKPLLTPTTKDIYADKPISAHEIIDQGLMSEKDFNDVVKIALELYEYGSMLAQKHGLILVDTKYEFGKDSDGHITLIDEVHTPDSSRYWLSHTYQTRFEQRLEPENIDKEFLRIWFAKNCNPYEDKSLPQAPKHLIMQLSERYIRLFELITGTKFEFLNSSHPILDRIVQNVSGYL